MADVRLIDEKQHHLRLSKKSMGDLFPDWKELPKDVQDKLCKLAKEHERELLNAPTVDAAPVVRCGVCRYCDTADCPMSGTPGRVSASDFCSYGERRCDNG